MRGFEFRGELIAQFGRAASIFGKSLDLLATCGQFARKPFAFFLRACAFACKIGDPGLDSRQLLRGGFACLRSRFESVGQGRGALGFPGEFLAKVCGFGFSLLPLTGNRIDFFAGLCEIALERFVRLPRLFKVVRQNRGAGFLLGDLR